MQQGTDRRALLLLDTCGERSSIAVFCGASCAAESLLPEHTASAALLSAVHGALQVADTTIEQLYAVGIASGPGSFTGLRIGLAIAKGLCEALGRPLVGISRLTTLMQASGSEVGLGVLSAGRKELYIREHAGDGTAREFLKGVDDIQSLIAGRSVAYAEPSLNPLLKHARLSTLVDLKARHLYPLVQARLSRRENELDQLDANYVREEKAIYSRISERKLQA